MSPPLPLELDLLALKGAVREIRLLARQADETGSFLRRNEILRQLDNRAAEAEQILRKAG